MSRSSLLKSFCRLAITEAGLAKRCLSRRERLKDWRSPESVPSGRALRGRIRERLEAIEKEAQISGASEVLEESDANLGSIAAEQFFRDHDSQYKSLTKRRQQIDTARAEASTNLATTDEVDLPLEGMSVVRNDLLKGNEFSISEETHRLENQPSIHSHSENGPAVDRGFYVEGDTYADEYIAGTALDIPDNEMDVGTLRFGPEDAVEEIEFQRPHQPSGEMNTEGSSDGLASEIDWLEDYGTADASVAASKKSCLGCGAKFHCKDPSLPGFLPVELFFKADAEKIGRTRLCRRCFMLEKHNFLLNVNVCDVDYRSVMQHLKLKQEALIILVVDMTDLPFSFYPELASIIGDKKPMIVVGNKIDLLPPDQRPGFLKHFRKVLHKTAAEAGFSEAFNILHVALLSAKTGFGVEDLITNIHLKWSSKYGSLRNNIYLIGCTNAGKSTLFNTFLRSDLCKVRALDLVDRATTSIWPGTTISLLKFPVMNISPHKLEIRRRRLLANRRWECKEIAMRRRMLKETGDVKYGTLQAVVENSYKDKEDELQPMSVLELRSQYGSSNSFEERKRDKEKLWNPDDKVFAEGNWCFDTPGTVNRNQVLNLFTLDELISVVPRKMIFPRTFILYAGESLLVGGVARLDVKNIDLKDGNAVFLSVFASDSLPINVLKFSEVAPFLDRYFGTAALTAPFGNAERLSRFPKLSGKKLEVSTLHSSVGAADLVFSSIGWICLTGSRGRVEVEAFTPEAKGIAVRTPPLLPYCANVRGSRIPGTAAYRVRPLEILLGNEFYMAERERKRRKKR